jgi:hypothetical protein
MRRLWRWNGWDRCRAGSFLKIKCEAGGFFDTFFIAAGEEMGACLLLGFIR